jgi:hypothetical protein
MGGRISPGSGEGLVIHGFDTLSLDGITFDDGSIELDIRGVTNYVANIIVGKGCKFDTSPSFSTQEAIIIGQPNPSFAVGGIVIAASMINGEAEASTTNGIDICNSVGCTAAGTIQILGVPIVQWGGNAIAIGGGTTNVVINDNTIYANNTRNLNAGFGGIYLGVVSGTISGITIVGNHIIGGTNQFCGVSLQNGTTNVFIDGNYLLGNVTAPICAATVVSGLVIGPNKGITEVEGTVVDAAALNIPNNPTFTLTGTGTTVTSFDGFWVWPGRTFTMLPTGAAISFTAGATIGKNYTTVTGVPVTGFVDASGVVWLK